MKGKKIEKKDLPKGAIHHKIPLMRSPGSIQLWGLNALCHTVNQMCDHDIETVIEVGSFAGESMQVFCKVLNPQLMICIDPYLEDGSISKEMGKDAPSMKIVEGLFHDRAAMIMEQDHFDVMVELRKETFHEFDADDYVKKSLLHGNSLIYIDGEHTYEAVRHDLEKASELHEEFGTIIAGHDYADGWPEVQEAVREFASKKGLPIITFEDESYLLPEFD